MTLFWTPFFGGSGGNPREKWIKRGSDFIKKSDKKEVFCPFFGDPQKWGVQKTPLFCRFLSKNAFFAKMDNFEKFGSVQKKCALF